jgi:hypothetical protein
MYEDGAKQLEAILALVKQCPEPLQEKCFTILLEGYVNSEQGRVVAPPPPATPAPASGVETVTAASLPQEVRGRIAALAKRLNVDPVKVEDQFDFTADPFVYHPMEAPGDNNADRTRNVTLLVAVRTYLATGSWTADWSEVKARCIDLNCYDGPNHATFLKRAKGTLFKTVEVGKTIELSGPGRTAAEKAFADLIAKE